MKLKKSDLLSLEQYDKERDVIKNEVIVHKKNRTLSIGDNIVLIFEDFLTIKYQVQEMLRIEKIFNENEVQEEIDAYNPLIPDGNNFKGLVYNSDITSQRVDGNNEIKVGGVQIISSSKCQLVKIDTDGFERKILASGQEGLQKHKPLAFFEFNPNAEIVKGYETTNYGIFQILQNINYTNIAVFYESRLLFAGDTIRDLNILKCFEDYCLGAVTGDILVAHKDKKDVFDQIVNAERQRNKDVAIKSKFRWSKKNDV